MKILGISGNLNLIHEPSDGDKHDASAVLIIDGKVVSAIEEERLNRVKHTDKFPARAIRFVLEENNLTLDDIDQVCYYFLPTYTFDGEEAVPLVKKIKQTVAQALGAEIDEKKIYFVHHHLAHAVSTFYMSGFEEGLVLSIDGQGDGISGMVLTAEGKKMEVLDKFSVADSLGLYYLKVIHILGYRQFDEYKVMGLAPYGDPSVYRDLFKSFYTLLPEGKYHIDEKQAKKSYLLTPRRKKDEPFTQVHKDIAAALQESVEEIVMHILTYYHEKYPYRKLCLAGGVAHNCSMNGRILYSGMFENIFIQPAAHDAGCALGAALYRYHELVPDAPKVKLEHLYWGPDLGGDGEIRRELELWSSFIEFERVENITKRCAELMANGDVIGWAQGRSEFGPRALGNRSIVADPRPERNKDIINEMVKKREAYRPFAPSVMEEYVEEYYDIPTENKVFPYMIFVVKAGPKACETLGAVTHADGTARIQTVSREANPVYWELIDEFRKVTGVPVVLNTSFNNNAESIVNSIRDTVVCFLTTKLNVLATGNYLARKKDIELPAYAELRPGLLRHNLLKQTNRFISMDGYERCYEIKNNIENGYREELSPEVFSLLNLLDGGPDKTLGELMEISGIHEEVTRGKVLTEVVSLWQKRFITLVP